MTSAAGSLAPVQTEAHEELATAVSPAQPTDLSIIVPMYNEADALPTLFASLRPVLDSIPLNIEVVCVDDGSRDATVEMLLRERELDPRIRIVSLARNFGKEAALSAGLAHARGRAMIPIDADLQDPPELIPKLVEEWQRGAEVVLAKRRSRASDSLPKRFSSGAFYWVFNRLSDRPIPSNVGDFQLLDRRAVSALLSLPERNRVMKALFSWVGFKRAVVEYDRPPRAAGETKWSPWRLGELALDAITAHTRKPLRFATYLGLLISALAMAYALFLIILVFVHGRDVPGYSSLMVTVLFLGGVQLVTIGIIGEYLGRVYDEVKQRPLYVVRELHGFDAKD
jgi:glycosyltransferase involved in cell wall biosynthesis